MQEFLEVASALLKIHWIAYIVTACVIGWLASVIMDDNANIIRNILLAIAGAFLAGQFISPLIGIGTINDELSIPTAIVTLIGSVSIIFIFKIIFGRRRK